MSEQDERLRTDDLVGPQPEQSESERVIAPIPPHSPPTGMDDTDESAQMGSAPSRTTHAMPEHAPLMAADKVEEYRSRWDAIQTHFVDAPREAVADADELVAELMRHLAEAFSRERRNLEMGWERGEDNSTEDLRVSFQHYRSFFNRLLAT